MNENNNSNNRNMSAWAAIGGAAASAGTSLLGQWVANAGNKKLAKYAYSKDLEMWNRQNEYNSPAAQMERFKEAGLNPNMIYESGSGSSGNASTLPRYNAPTVSYDVKLPNLIDVLGKYQDFEIKQAQTNVLNEEFKIRAAEAKWRNEMLEAKWFDAYTKGQMSKSDYLRKSAGLQAEFGFTPEGLDSRSFSSPYDVGKYDEMIGAIRKNKLEVLSKSNLDIAKMQTMNAIAEMQRKWFRYDKIRAGIGSLTNLSPAKWAIPKRSTTVNKSFGHTFNY